MAKKMPQYVHNQICAFCDNVANSDEHFLGNWLNKIFPRLPNQKSIQRSASVIGGVGKPPRVDRVKATLKNGTATTRSKRIVCADCNNDWMSQIQDAAIQPMTKMILDSDFVVTAEDRFALARWATMVSMTFEFDDISTLAIPRSQRVQFKEQRKPFEEGWQIWAGMHVGEDWDCRIEHTGFRSYRIGTPPPGEYIFQSTLIGLHHLDVFVFSGPFTPHLGSGLFPVEFSEITRVFGLMQVWPPTEVNVPWRKLDIKSESDMDELSTIIAHMLHRNNNNPILVDLAAK